MQNNTSKPFYNTTIPSDWEEKLLGNIFKLTSGKTKPEILTDNQTNECSYPVYGGNGIMGYTSEHNCIGEKIIIGRVGEYCGITRFINEMCWITDNALFTKEFLKVIDIKFLSYKLQHEDISKLRSKGGQPLVSQMPIYIHKITLPKSIPEQRAIAHVLGLMDAAINKNNKLITQKELQKKWLMQNLLTGKKRLNQDLQDGEKNLNQDLQNGKRRLNQDLQNERINRIGSKYYPENSVNPVNSDSDSWKEVRLGDIFEFIKSYSISREGLTKFDNKDYIYCIHYGDIHAFYETDFLDFSTQKSIPQIVDEAYPINERDFLREGDVIIADASEDYEGVGEAVVVFNIEDNKVVGGLHTIVLREFKRKTSPAFRAYLFASEKVRNELRKKATGTSVYSVTKTTLESLVLYLPSLSEQTAIAKVLQAADKELQLLKAKTEKLREQKKGMMQVLLTGKKRLKVSESGFTE